VIGTLPDNIKAGILALIHAAIKLQEGFVASGRNCPQVAL